MASRYVDVPAIVQVIAAVYVEPTLLDNESYTFSENDFTEEMHKVVFGSIYNLHLMGVTQINESVILDYLSNRAQSLAVFKLNKGEIYLENLRKIANVSTFDYYYQRLKKMTLLRSYNEICGMNLNWLYDKDNLIDGKKKQKQEEWLDNMSLEEIADLIDKKITDIKLSCLTSVEGQSTQAGSGLLDLLEKYKKIPDVGIPMYGDLINTITRGARLKKFYLRSAATGVGKSRTLVADACFFSCGYLYNINTQCWDELGAKESTVFITTEQEEAEIQTMMTAFLSGVNERQMLIGQYTDSEWDRVKYAAKILNDAPLYIRSLPDFSLKDIEDIIKAEIREHDVKYVVFDYIHTSMKILSEVSSKAGIKGLREDNVLFMISTRLKDLCNKYGIFIISATQLNAEYRTAVEYDQNLLRGAKSIADKIDCGMIMLEVDQKDVESLSPILQQNGLPIPNIKISVYKNRGGEFKSILVWCTADRSICRFDPIFVTDYSYQLIDMPNLNIKVEPPSAFEG